MTGRGLLPSYDSLIFGEYGFPRLEMLGAGIELGVEGGVVFRRRGRREHERAGIEHHRATADQIAARNAQNLCGPRSSINGYLTIPGLASRLISIENSVSRVRSAVGRVVSPSGALSNRRRSTDMLSGMVRISR